jgi:multiple sugar transport system permease protein
VLLRIMLPLAMPGLASAGLFAAIMTWNEFLMALTMTSGGTTAPITVGIAAMVQPYDMRWGQMAAAGSVAVIPIVLLTIVANRKIVAGLTRGAVKG